MKAVKIKIDHWGRNPPRAKKIKVTSWSLIVKTNEGDKINLWDLPNGMAQDIDEWLRVIENECSWRLKK